MQSLWRHCMSILLRCEHRDPISHRHLRPPYGSSQNTALLPNRSRHSTWGQAQDQISFYSKRSNASPCLREYRDRQHHRHQCHPYGEFCSSWVLPIRSYLATNPPRPQDQSLFLSKNDMQALLNDAHKGLLSDHHSHRQDGSNSKRSHCPNRSCHSTLDRGSHPH